ncbi:MAG: diguanylate cyclase, partial [Gammaproteobacteria bacterium]|nr:diguanylate cyclase [Gammaproteobacteria bacterium]
PASLSANGIMTMTEDRQGRVWVGTFGGGISLYDPKTERFTRFQPSADDPRSLSSNRVTSIAEDPSGRMWVGTDSGGLNLYDPKSGNFHRFAHNPDDPKTLAADTVYAVNVDADGTVWVGTQGGGLDRVVGDAASPDEIYFSNISHADGLANNVVYGIQFDDAGWVWMSTNFGISRYHPESGQIKNLHRKDGLQSEEFNFGAHHRSDSGELFFGGINGFNAFDPKDIQPSKIVPLIAMTGFVNLADPTKSDLPTEESESIEISWKDDVVAFDFAVMDYVAPAQNRFQYKLEGFDRDWIDLGNRNRVTYTDLNDGNYLLRVKAANSEGVWNEAGFSVPVRVTAAPWDTWWAYLGYVAVFAQLVFFLWTGHRRKVRREEEYSHRLELEVNSRTEKLLDKNKQLHLLNQALQESSLSDPLTGLRNRRFVFEEVSRDLDVIQRRLADERECVDKSEITDLVFMMIDLDNFKPINDTYGHAAGDQMLLELRDVLLGICRRSDFVIRWGGDEFVVIAKQTRHGEAEALAERIRSSVANQNFTLSDGQIVRTTCSIGFASYPLFRAQADESSLDQIISLADGLMYEAKKKRNAWVGMLGPSEATTSFDSSNETIESTSLLFRARRAGNLNTFSSEADGQRGPLRLSNAG